MGNPKEAYKASPEGEEFGIPPPPAYSEYPTHPHSLPSNPSPYPTQRLQQQQHQAPSPSYSQANPTESTKLKFPPALNAYMQMKFTPTYHLGEHKETPLYLIRTHSGLTKNPELVLYDGPTDSHPVLATANRESMWKPKRSILTIPLREGMAHDAASQKIQMSMNWSLTSVTYTFESDVGVGQDVRREQFEWRRSHGDEVRELKGYSYGWKLVRLSVPARGGGAGPSRPLGTSSDGHEIVAVWTHNSSMSMSKAFKFQFVGRSLTGVMGDRWATLALMSALRIFWLEIQQAQAAAT